MVEDNSGMKFTRFSFMRPLSKMLIVGVLFAQVGCRSVADFDAADLPMELNALAASESTSIDLSRIARKSINANVIYPGDVLDVTIASGMESTPPSPTSIRVNDSGYVSIPLIGDVHVAGLSLTAAERAIQEAGGDRQIYKKPLVSLLTRQRRTIMVRVVGAVANPGVYDLPAAGSDLLSAIVAAGGLSDEAGTIVELRHPNSHFNSTEVGTGVRLASFADDRPSRTIHVDLRDAPAQRSNRFDVEDGTVVMVMPKTERTISVLGLVKRPGSYELISDDNTRVLDALALAGDRTLTVADRVRIIRRIPNSDGTKTIQVSVGKAQKKSSENILIAAGDTIIVEETPLTFTVSTIRGFLRFGFSSAIPGI